MFKNDLFSKIFQLFQLLSPKERYGAFILGLLMILGMGLEMLGIGLVVPAMTLMTQADPATSFPAMKPWIELLGNPAPAELIRIGMALLVAIYAFKSVFLGFLAWAQAKFAFGLFESLSSRLLAGYLQQPYAFHLKRNSSQLIHNAINITREIASLSQRILLVVAELMVLTGISALLLYVEPLGAVLVVSTLGIASWGFNRVTRKHLLRWGDEFQEHEEMRIKHMQQVLGGAKEVKLLGREKNFLDKFKEHTKRSADVSEYQTTLHALPRLWLELLSVTGLAGLVLVMLGRGETPASLVPTLGLFGAAAFRVLPGINRLTLGFQSGLFFLPAINILNEELKLIHTPPPSTSGQALSFKESLKLENISFKYESSDAAALAGVTLAIPHGASIGFVGTTGAGKSTLIDVVLGLLKPTTGKITVDGIDINNNLRSWQNQIGYVPQSIFLTDDSLRNNIAFGVPDSDIDETSVKEAIEAAQLSEFLSELPRGLDTIIGERGVRLSGGQRQRIGIARALYGKPQVLVLDEATSSLDNETEEGVMKAVEALQGKITILTIAHRLTTIQHCNTLYRLTKGKLSEEPIQKNIR